MYNLPIEIIEKILLLCSAKESLIFSHVSCRYFYIVRDETFVRKRISMENIIKYKDFKHDLEYYVTYKRYQRILENYRPLKIILSVILWDMTFDHFKDYQRKYLEYCKKQKSEEEIYIFRMHKTEFNQKEYFWYIRITHDEESGSMIFYDTMNEQKALEVLLRNKKLWENTRN